SVLKLWRTSSPRRGYSSFHFANEKRAIRLCVLVGDLDSCQSRRAPPEPPFQLRRVGWVKLSTVCPKLSVGSRARLVLRETGAPPKLALSSAQGAEDGCSSAW